MNKHVKKTANAQVSHLHTTRIDIEADSRVTLVAMLNQHLADTFDLYAQTKQAHWNIKGMHFLQLHELFDSLAATIFPFIDMIAERATSLGGVAKGTARMAASNSRLEEFPAGPGEGKEFLSALADRYSTLAASTRAAIGESEDLGDVDTRRPLHRSLA